MWLFAGGIAFIIAVVNIILALVGKYKYCCTLVWISLSSGLIAMLGQYILINEWVQASDMSALTDVVPTMNNVLIAAVCVLIALNAITAFLKSKRLRNTLVAQ